MAWQVYEMPTDVFEVHVVPLLDTRFHTWPICWCHPRRSSERVWSHNAVSVSV